MSDAQNQNLAESIFRELRAQILRGELKPGERLPGERELAQRHDTNRNTLREAVRKLEQARLVTVRHGQGVTVADFRKSGTMELLPPLLEAGPHPSEVAMLLEDVLPARVLVIEFASRLASRRAHRADLEQLRDITDLLISACERGDPVVIARGFARWMDTVIEATHSTGVRWIANPFLEAYRELVERFPSLWVLDPSFPTHLREFLDAMERGDEEAIGVTLRKYYGRIDGAFMRALAGALPAPSATSHEVPQKSAPSHKKPAR